MTTDIGWNRKETGGCFPRRQTGQVGQSGGGIEGKGTEQRPVNEQMLDWYYSMREEGRTGETKEEYAARVYAKVQMGKELTIEELRFLERTNPVLYQKAMRMMNMRKMLEHKLKSCKSKEEAQEVFSRAVSGISDKDPDKGMLVAALKDVYTEFTKSDAYKKLPEKEEDGKKDTCSYLDFDVDESGYQIVFAQESGVKAFTANG